jgi:hypothetical protein
LSILKLLQHSLSSCGNHRNLDLCLYPLGVLSRFSFSGLHIDLPMAYSSPPTSGRGRGSYHAYSYSPYNSRSRGSGREGGFGRGVATPPPAKPPQPDLPHPRFDIDGITFELVKNGSKLQRITRMYPLPPSYVRIFLKTDKTRSPRRPCSNSFETRNRWHQVLPNEGR